MKKNKNTKGQVMLLSSLIIGGSILAATSVAGYLMLLKVRESTDITNSSKAITAASSGIDWGLYKKYKNSNVPDISFTNGAQVKVNILDDGTIISIGKSGNSFRAFELNSAGADQRIP